jgi:hypothetical protein
MVFTHEIDDMAYTVADGGLYRPRQSSSFLTAEVPESFKPCRRARHRSIAGAPFFIINHHDGRQAVRMGDANGIDPW